MKISDHHSQSSIVSHIAEYLLFLKNQRYSEKSLDSYGRALMRFNAFLLSKKIIRAQDVEPEHLNAYRLYLTDLNLSNATLYLYLRSVRSFFSWLEENQYIFLNPAQSFILPKFERRLQHVPSEADMKAVLTMPDTTTAVGVRDRALLETAYSCGLRREELTRLTLFDPDIGQGVMRITGKGNKERVVPLGKRAVLWLKKYMKTERQKLFKDPDEQALWLSKTSGKKLTYARIDKVVRDYAVAAGIEQAISCHAIRRACATHMLRNGAHPVQIQMLLGHSSLQTLSQYLKVTITDMKKMHEQSRLGK